MIHNLRKPIMETLTWIIEINAPSLEKNYTSYYTRLKPVLEYTKYVSVPSKPNTKLGLSGFDVSLKFCKFLQEREPKLEFVFHLTCHDVDKFTLVERLDTLMSAIKIKHLLIITGDYYQQVDRFKQFYDSDELVSFISAHKRGLNGYVAVGGYPGGNLRTSFTNSQEKLRLERKMLHNSKLIYTQCLFQLDTFENFLMEMGDNSISGYRKIEIIPSVGLFKDIEGLRRIQRLTRASQNKFIGCQHDEAAVPKSPETYLIDVCNQLHRILKRYQHKQTIDLCTFGHFDLSLKIIETLKAAQVASDATCAH